MIMEVELDETFMRAVGRGSRAGYEGQGTGSRITQTHKRK